MARQRSPKRGTLERALEGKPRWFRLLVVIALLLMVLAPTCGYPGYTAYEAATAQQATAVVERCSKATRGGRTCHGSWQLPDGRRGAGEIDGADRDQIGTRISVWATPRSATTHRWGWWVMPGIFGCAWVFAIFFVGLVLRRLARREGRTPPAE